MNLQVAVLARAACFLNNCMLSLTCNALMRGHTREQARKDVGSALPERACTIKALFEA